MPGAEMTSLGGMALSPRFSITSLGNTICASCMGLAFPHPFLTVELTWQQISASVAESSFSNDVPLGSTLRSSTWFFSQRPFWSGREGSVK